ncbi:hypothetical protein VSDG_02017 [Cytospora chrysosperma]|uniref:Uncharacterized protein n=1 Tax=Cytospora chrysosperma TaxID=252740 RepID=A0A423WE26_CYTCH|nr:hypothetical protein VSDG_02017 [Valsa sordida]
METADHDPALEGRGYVPNYTVRYRGSQRAEHRFGPGRRAEIQEMLHQQDEAQDPPDFNGQWEDFPHVARARMNLTALAQHYDLYFVAYRGFVYAYRLGRGVKVALGEPEAILDPKYHETEMSKHVDGYINPNCPHEINHMIVGELGEEEILLVGRDNGDVVAWYTRSIAHYIETNMSMSKGELRRDNERAGYASRPSYPKHFFADNVGISAWGLAIHKQSRLIAVSSNAHEITVFAFAMNRRGEPDNPPSSGTDEDDTHEPMPTGGKEAVDITPSRVGRGEGEALKGPLLILVMGDGVWQLPMYPWEPDSDWAANLPEFAKGRRAVGLDRVLITESEAKARVARLQRRFQTRQRSWRIVLSLGMEASNVPSIAFCEDAEGNANRVAGIDINGYLYIIDIWQIGRKPIRIPPHNVQTPAGRRNTAVRGWNVLPIMDAQLLPTDTVHAAIGLHPSKAVHRAKTSRGTWLDISKCMAEVGHDAASKLHQRRVANFRPADVSGERDGLTAGGVPGDGDALTTPLLSSQILDPVLDPHDGEDLGAGPVHLAVTVVPYSGAHHAAFPTPRAMVDFSGPRAAAGRAQRLRAALSLAQFRQKARLWDAEDLLRDVGFLRFNEQDVEMLSLGEADCGTVCHHVLENWNAHNQPAHWDMQFGQRCSMLLRVPELSLVVVGSMCGRVALLTLTRPPQLEEALAPSRARVPRRAFRVDAVLPFEAEERARERPFVCLLGIAVSPVPEARTRGLELRRKRRGRGREGGPPGLGSGLEPEAETGPEPPRRWRLILNYQDHTVLQYEINKREEGEEEGVGVTGSWRDFTGPTAYRGDRFRATGEDEDEDVDDDDDGDGDGTRGDESEGGAGSDGAGTDLNEADHPGWEHEEMMAAMGEGQWVETDSDEDDFPDMQIG